MGMVRLHKSMVMLVVYEWILTWINRLIAYSFSTEKHPSKNNRTVDSWRRARAAPQPCNFLILFRSMIEDTPIGKIRLEIWIYLYDIWIYISWNILLLEFFSLGFLLRRFLVELVLIRHGWQVRVSTVSGPSAESKSGQP